MSATASQKLDATVGAKGKDDFADLAATVGDLRGKMLDLKPAADGAAGSVGDIAKATAGATLATHAWNSLLAGNYIQAISAAAKATKAFWASLGGPFVWAAAGAFAATSAIIYGLDKLFGTARVSVGNLEKGMEEAGKAGEAAGAKMAETAKTDFSAAAASAKQITDELDRAAKMANELQAAKDRLADANMAAELEGSKAAREAEIAAAGGDKAKEGAINLKYDRADIEIRNRYAAAAAEAGVSKAVTARDNENLAIQGKRSANERIQGAAARADAAVESAQDQLRSDQARAADRQEVLLQKKNRTPAEDAELRRLVAGQAARRGQAPTYTTAAAEAAKIVADPRSTFGAVAEAQKQLAAINALPKLLETQKEARAKAAESATGLAIAEDEHTIRSQALSLDIETAKRAQQRASSGATAALAGQGNKETAFVREQAAERQRAVENERQQKLREQQEARNRMAADVRQRGGALIRGDVMPGVPSAIAGRIKETEREALNRLVEATKTGTTADLLRQLNEALRARNSEEAAILRESIAISKRLASQRANDPRR
jgi:hypothetical protein